MLRCIWLAANRPLHVLSWPTQAAHVGFILHELLKNAMMAHSRVYGMRLHSNRLVKMRHKTCNMQNAAMQHCGTAACRMSQAQGQQQERMHGLISFRFKWDIMHATLINRS